MWRLCKLGTRQFPSRLCTRVCLPRSRSKPASFHGVGRAVRGSVDGLVETLNFVRHDFHWASIRGEKFWNRIWSTDMEELEKEYIVWMKIILRSEPVFLKRIFIPIVLWDFYTIFLQDTNDAFGGSISIHRSSEHLLTLIRIFIIRLINGQNLKLLKICSPSISRFTKQQYSSTYYFALDPAKST